MLCAILSDVVRLVRGRSRGPRNDFRAIADAEITEPNQFTQISVSLSGKGSFQSRGKCDHAKETRARIRHIVGQRKWNARQ